ncbi:MAG: hypothetical protein JSS86_03355 [Cyanobacteria bacterium SZAS LIN-2]|nr:hypothetical protein [Cyanobacteria bacterium SZAS LIN-2]
MSKKNTILAILGVVVLFGGLLYYTTTAMTSKYKFDPNKAFTTAFDEDPLRIEGPLVVTPSDNGNYDTWMYFRYPHEAKMQHESEFQTAWCAEAAAWFSSRVKDPSGLKDINHIKFRRRIDNQATIVTNEWIIYNPRTDEHFYRTWGTAR